MAGIGCNTLTIGSIKDLLKAVTGVDANGCPAIRLIDAGADSGKSCNDLVLSAELEIFRSWLGQDANGNLGVRYLSS